MPSPPLANTLEGGSNGTGITAGNSGGGSGDAFQTASVSGTDTLEYSNVQARGTLSARIVTSATPANVYLEWTGLGAITGNVYTRFYLYLGSYPTSSLWIARSFDTSGTASTDRTLELRLSADGSLRLQDQGGATIADIATAIGATGAWYRVETRLSCAAGTGELRVYSDPDGTTPSGSSSGSGTLGSDQDNVRFGIVSGASTFPSRTMYLDNLAVATADWIGPAAGALTKAGAGVIGP